MDDQRPDELAELQRRAYGRGSDIERDPGALARLSALEARVRPAPGTARPDAAAPGNGITEDAAPDDAAPPADASADEASEPLGHAPPRRSRRRSLLLLAALAATAAVAVGASLLATAGDGQPGREVAVLPLSNGTDLPGWEGLGFDGSVTTEDFGGLTVVRQSLPADTGLTVVRQRRSASAGSCLSIVRTADPQDGLFFQGCTAGAFPAVAQFTVTSAAPEALRERFPIGTSLRFALEGDEIRVRSDAR
ncbi:hypothetical protein C5D34_10720 [Rathayibacter sp. AY1B1]|uniref:hypothetical protein n=1 Tax=unclassified Rathayibacter TaxID=2609250 RepID=UPI000CE890D7|nr:MULTISPECIES: hypothetical protein [unclassified Rathayibacter]PPI24005.1 hypothetical protein C5D08_04105 [Rathayibacter sp. AY1B6]PPI33528.1 hypothetical protein C5D34_10720 [Rathayibacter sp. AY1B1]